MTVRINFLPRNYQPPKQLGVKEWGIAAAAALAIVATGAYYTSVYAGTADLEHQVSASQAKLQNVKTLLAQADEIKLREARITKAESDLKVLAGRHWSTTLLTLVMIPVIYTVFDDVVGFLGRLLGRKPVKP
jgi:Flp pilus assembly protein TadB